MGKNVVPPHPAPFIDVRVKDVDKDVWLFALCAGYELEEWREKELVEHVFEWLPEFALSSEEVESIGASNCMRQIRKAAKAMYKSEKYKSRGEFGELLLHIALRQELQTIPTISKLHYKDNRNDTVKGFDCVHVVPVGDELQLWLGEVKFYKEIRSAIRDVIEELKDHTEKNYLKDEFTAILNKVQSTTPYSNQLKKLFDKNTSLDEVFDVMCIPVLLTYDSDVISGHSRVTESFKREFEKEVEKIWKMFIDKGLPSEVQVHLFLFPLKSKASLQESMHKELQKWN